ncbi:MAG: hypothetical protein K2O16_10635 [Lachnospiraceae bacterium]|nr:hypothetical protein [Lachnospiraceae bacterium]
MNKWVTAFTLPQYINEPCFGGGETTMRLIIPINVYGDRVRIRISNASESRTGIMEEMTIARCDNSGKILKESMEIVTFLAETYAIKISPQSCIVSEEIPFEVHPGDFLAVSVYCREDPVSVGGIGSYVMMPVQKGNYCREDFVDENDYHLIEEQYHQPMMWQFPYFHAMDVMTENEVAVISCLGDSVTAQAKWYRPLQEYLYAAYPGQICLTNYGICGNKFLSDAEGNMPMFGKAVLKRVEWDCFSDYGVTHILLAIGVNDIGQGRWEEGRFLPTEEEFEKGCLDLKERAHQRGIVISAFSIYPAELSEEQEGIRQKFNQVIKSGVFDASIDLDGILMDIEKGGYPEGYSMDGIHLTEYGGACMIRDLNKEEVKRIIYMRYKKNI